MEDVFGERLSAQELLSQPNDFHLNKQMIARTSFDNLAQESIGPNYSLQKQLNNMFDTFSQTNKNALFGHSESMNSPIWSTGNSALEDQSSNLASSSSSSSGSTENNPPKQDTISDLFSASLKKYDVKRYLLKKILGNSHDLDEDDGGFFSNKHLKRHGTAGVAAKVIGELIGIKIRESIESLGKSFSEYAKDFTARNFVNLGQFFGKVFKAN